jgi:hypothetical protein
VLKHGEVDRTVRMEKEAEGKRLICDWTKCASSCSQCVINEYVEEFVEKFDVASTYDEAVEFLEGK